MEREKSDAENLLKSANAINQSRRNLEQNIKFLEDKENLHDLGIAFGVSGFVLAWAYSSKNLADFRRFDVNKTLVWGIYVISLFLNSSQREIVGHLHPKSKNKL